MSEIMSQTRARWRRLRSMDRAEIRHRAHEAAARQLERLAKAPTHEALAAEIPSALGVPDERAVLGYLRETVAPRFWVRPGTRELLGLRTVLADRMPDAVAGALDTADSLLAGHLRLLGREPAQLPSEVDWHRDPYAGGRWPLRFWADYDLVHGDNPGDPKVIHELNRHQHLPRLALGWLLAGDERYAAAAQSQLASWIEQNPPRTGVNWHSALEIGIRAISWYWTLMPLSAWPGLEPRLATRALASLRAQLDHVWRYPSVFSSPNTHLLGEAAALYMGGLLFPELDTRSRWLATGHAHLVAQADDQVLGDGVHAELSTTYHCYALDFWLLAMTLARRNGQRLGAAVGASVTRQARFLRHLTRDDGSLPNLGDDDGGRALALDRRDYRSFTDGLCTAGVLLDRDELIAAAGGLHFETLWLLGTEAAERTRSIAGKAAHGERHTPTVSFPDAGYHVQRAGRAHLVFDTGSLGHLGGGHGHADALAVVLHTGGTEMLVDPGTELYNGDAERRDAFRATRAHNTLTVDGADQSLPDGTFRWASRANARLIASRSWPGLAMLEGEHDGYRRLPGGVVHRRRVLLVDDSYWLIFDDLRGAGEHDFDLWFHLAPTALGERRPQLRGDDGGVHLDLESGNDRLTIHTTATGIADAELVRGERLPWQGWMAPRYGARRAAPVLRLAARATAPFGFLTALVPGDPAIEVAAIRARDAVAGLRIRRGGGEDLAFLAPGATPFSHADVAGEGEVLWLRTRAGEPTRLLARTACSLRHRGIELIGSRGEGAWFEWGRRPVEES